MRTDFLIVGAGLAGSCAALWLSELGRVVLLEAKQAGAGASGAAAGLVNPLMGRKAKPSWRFEAALDALHATLDLAGAADLFRAEGLLRPARDARQADFFRDRADEFPNQADWLMPQSVAERYPDLDAPHGGLWIKRGGAVDLRAVVEALVTSVETRGGEVRQGIRLTRWGEEDAFGWVENEAGDRFEARTVLLALGDGFRHHSDLIALGLHRIKGQTIRLARPPGLGLLPPLSGLGYVVPESASIVVGSSYEHDFADLAPSPQQSVALRANAARMVPALADAEILEARAGVRVGVPGDRMPLLGPLPGHRRVWTLTGLGSKGLLTAPLLTRGLPGYLADAGTIPVAVRLARGRLPR